MYRNSAEAFKEFEEGSIWQDMLGELELWLGDVHEAMEDPKGVLSDGQHAQLRGNAETIRKIGLLPAMIQENILADTKENTLDNEEGE